jgi:hypothetical protein
MKKQLTHEFIPILSTNDVTRAFQPVNPNEIDEEIKIELDEERESLLRESKEYKIEIDWYQFDESQIQILIALLYQNMGYSIENWHKSDRAREDGADLIVRKVKNDIAIAVKIKPKQEDRPQLMDLYNRKEKRKIYVYIKTPTRIFYDFMKKYQDKVEFWDATRLNEYFVENNLGFTTSLILDNHKISKTVQEIQQTLFGIRENCLKLSTKKAQTLDRQSLKLLWRLKDEAVSLYKTNLNVITLLERPLNIKNNQLNEHLLKIFIEYFDILDNRLKIYTRYFNLFYKNNENIVNNSVISEINRSHWNHLLQYRIDNSLQALEEDLERSMIMEKVLKKQKENNRNREMENYWKEKSKNNDVWSVMESRVRNFMIFGAGLEEIVDDIFKEFVETFVS